MHRWANQRHRRASVLKHCVSTTEAFKERKSQEDLPVVKAPSEMKKEPTVRPTAAANLKNQNLRWTQVSVKC